MRDVYIGTVFKNEARYLREWIEFHRIVGVSKFYLYNNNSEDNYLAVLQPYMDKGIVDLKQWPSLPPTNVLVYSDCFQRLTGQDIWLACIDCDEFLFSPKYSTISEALNTLPESWGAVAVNWRCFGSSGKEVWEDVPVIERFTYRSKHVFMDYMDRHIKSIVRMSFSVFSVDQIHYFTTTNGTYNEIGEQVCGTHTNTHNFALLRLNHYWCKSRQEWIDRINTGKPDMKPGTVVLDWEIYDRFQPKDIEDKSIQVYLPRLKV